MTVGPTRYDLSIAWVDADANTKETAYKHIGTLTLTETRSDEHARKLVVPLINALIAADPHYHFDLTRWQTNGDEVKLPHR